MAKFQFRFDVLLRLKKQMEQDVKNKLAMEVKKLEDAKNEEESRRKRRIEKMNEQKKLSLKGVRVGRLQEFTTYLIQLDKDILKSKEKVNEMKKNVDIIREELKNVLKERQILEKLRERDFERYQKEMMKKEQLLADEVTGYKHATKHEQS
jgi:flagellar FliJ protein